jgi:hypothetical protein
MFGDQSLRNDQGKTKLQLPLLQVSLPAATVFYWNCDFEGRPASRNSLPFPPKGKSVPSSECLVLPQVDVSISSLLPIHQMLTKYCEKPRSHAKQAFL